LVEQSDDVITGGIPGKPGAIPLRDVATIGDWASSSVSSNFLAGWPTQAGLRRRSGAEQPAESRPRVLEAGNFVARPPPRNGGDRTSVLRAWAVTFAAAAHIDERDSAAGVEAGTRWGYDATEPFHAAEDDASLPDWTE